MLIDRTNDGFDVTEGAVVQTLEAFNYDLPSRGLPVAPSRFEMLAVLSARPMPELGAVLGVLLAAADIPECRGRPALRPLWAEEAMHRAYNVVRLVDARNRRCGPAGRSSVFARVEHALARDLAAQIRSLGVGHEDDVQPCSGILRDVVADLGALFGAAAGEATVGTDIERLALPVFRRRALVLAACELVVNALLHAFHARSDGRIEVRLTSPGSGHGRLVVADDGTGFGRRRPNLQCGVAAGLADVLGGDLVYGRVRGWTTAEILFPIAG